MIHRKILSVFIMLALPFCSYSKQQASESTQISSLTFDKRLQINGNIGPVYSLVWSPDSMRLASAGFQQVKLWNCNSGENLNTLAGHGNFVWGVAWSPDGSRIASASQDGTVRLWDSETYVEETAFNTGWAFCVDWSDDGNRFATGNYADQVQVWDVDSSSFVFSHSIGASSYDGYIISLDWSADGQKIAAGYWSGAILIIDAKTGERLDLFTNYTPARCDVNGIAWSPDGRTLASAHQDGKVRLWNIQFGTLKRALLGHFGWVRGIAWSPDGSMFASTGEDATVRLWEAQSGQLLATKSEHSTPVWSAAWSPDGQQLATGSGNYNSTGSSGNSIIIWSVQISDEVEFVQTSLPANFRLRNNFPNPFNPVTTIQFDLPHPSNVTITIYNIQGRLVRSLLADQSKPAGTHSINWDGKNENGMAVGSGEYFYKFTTDSFSETKKMLLLR